MKPTYSDLRNRTRQILDSVDDDLLKEIQALREAKQRPQWVREGAEAMATLTAGGPATEGAAPDFEMETIVQRVGRPVLAVVQGQAELRFNDPASAVWQRRLEGAAPKLVPVIAAIGRIEVANHPWLDYAGTGWMIDSDIVVTNRHVALEFADRGARGFVFRTGFDRRNPITVNIDFLEEIGNAHAAEYPIGEVLFIAPDNGPDVAFLRLRSASLGNAPKAVAIATEIAPARTLVATIGYPARDTRIPDQALMDRIFGGIYDKKRMAPGLITGQELGSLLHDCSTLGGNSGSALIDLATGEAVGLHFAGTFLETNYALPSTVLITMLQQARAAPLVVPSTQSLGTGSTAMDQVPSTGSRSTIAAAPMQDLKVTVPVEITVRIGSQTTGVVGARVSGDVGSGDTAKVSTRTSREQVERAVELARRQLAGRPDVVAVEGGYRFRDGWITDERAVVVSVRRKYSLDELEARGTLPIPTSFLGVQVDVTIASAAEVVSTRDGVALERVGGWVSNYDPTGRPSLSVVEEPMKVVVHASPDAGWPVLSGFLGQTKKRLTIGMYDFTARHIVDAVKTAVPGKKPLKLVIQATESLEGATKQDDIPDAETVSEFETAKGTAFEYAWASVSGPNRLFDSAYHIKVAVRDGEAFWLSSGNWQSSNQPPFDPIKDGDQSPPLLKQYNREWHAVVENATLAQVFENHLARDLTDCKAVGGTPESLAGPELWVPIDYFLPTAAELEAPTRYFNPATFDDTIRVQPLLTPDNYAAHVLDLIKSSRERIYFQNQSFSPLDTNAEEFQSLLEAMRDQQVAGLDVRIIFRRIGDVRKTVTRIKDFGFDMDKVRIQTNCHTKGIVVDSKIAVLGSHNWTNAGVRFNRDASLIFFHQDIARYFEALFLYDWGRIGKPKIDESVPAVELVRPEESRPRPGMVRIPAWKWFGE